MIDSQLFLKPTSHPHDDMIKYAICNITRCAAMARYCPSLQETVVGTMKILIRLICSFALLLGVHNAFACDYPTKASVANGSTATKEDMIESQKSVKKFVGAMEAYLECIVGEEKAARSALGELQPEDEQQREEMLSKKYNAAVDDMEKVAARFNAEVQAYKGKDGS